jgi:hypothetical protein
VHRHKRRRKETSENARTLIHVRHFADLPFGEITIEVTSTVKHCITGTEKSPTIKMGWKKKESIVQN